MKKLSIVIPCYNEENTIGTILQKIAQLKLPVQKEIIVINDGSTDQTKTLLDGPLRHHIDILIHQKNNGKGKSLQIGFQHASGDYIIIQDADLEYDPKDYIPMLQEMLDKKNDVVYGSRLLTDQNKTAFQFTNYWANKWLTWLSNQFTKQTLTDMETCYKLFKREVIQSISLDSPRFGIEPELTAKISHLGIRIKEIPIQYDGRNKSNGKKIGWLDGLEAILCIIRYSRSHPTKHSLSPTN